MVSIQENGELVKGSWNRREVEKPGTIKGGPVLSCYVRYYLSCSSRHRPWTSVALIIDPFSNRRQSLYVIVCCFFLYPNM